MLNTLFEKFMTVKISYNQFNISDSLKCTMSLASSKDVQEAIKCININLPQIPSKLCFTALFLGMPIRGEIHENGTVAISHPSYEVILDKIASRREDIFKE